MIRRAIEASLARRPLGTISFRPRTGCGSALAESFPSPSALLLLPAVPALIVYAASINEDTEENNRRCRPSVDCYLHPFFGAWKNRPSFLSNITSERFTAPSRTCCEASPDKTNNSNNDNPLWPSGVPPAMVNAYVDEILSDPKINLASVPDTIERALYVTTVQTTLNTVYQALSGLHGTELLGHLLILKRVPPSESGAAAFSWKDLPAHHPSSRRIDARVLTAMADELLRNRAINQAWLPDILERQIYTNCLLIIFTLLDRLADTLSVRVCGHELGMRFEPVTEQAGRELVRRQQQQKLQLDTATIDALVEGMLRETREQQQQQTSASASASSSYWPQNIPLQDKVLFSVHKTLCELF